MNEKPISIEEKINNLQNNQSNIEHKIDVLIKLHKETQAHVWNKSGDNPTPINLEEIVHQESQATNYVNNVVLPKLKKRESEKEAGLMEAESWGAFLTPIWNYVKQESITFIGHTLKELAIQGAVEASKWLMEQGEKTILNLYNNASSEEKELFKEKVREVFPDSELLKKLG